MTVHKFFTDRFYSNEYLANVGGISLNEANNLQVVFLQMIDYEINITQGEYKDYEDSLTIYFATAIN